VNLGPVHTTYCLNIHPGESWEQNLAAIREHVPQVRAALGHDAPFGLGLRLSARAAAELAVPGQLEVFRSLLADQGLYVFTVNAFPYGTFHGTRVKERVYAPDWTADERVAYTLHVARILAALLPEDVAGSISTVPGTYRAWATPEGLRSMAVNLARTVAELAVLETRTGRRIQLALEPEPDCLWDTAADCARLFNEELPELADIPESRVQRHLGVCIDTCHQAVIFDSPAASLRCLFDAGVPVAKIQVSAAPIFPCTPAGLAQAERFVDPCYLHQTAIRRPDGAVLRFPDLPEALAAARSLPEDSELRTHFHIPLCVDAWETMRSTRAELDAGFWRLALDAGITQFEAETYTFDVLPAALRERSVAENVAAELRWLRQALADG
jgi:hypothetical protein